MFRRLTAAMAGALLLALPATANAACAHRAAVPSAATVAKARAATLCLLNQQRRAHGLRPLHNDTRLQRAASGYSGEMVRLDFFDHTAPDGTTFDRRIVAAGYKRFSALAENIAWGAGSLATPARIVRDWMHSPGHRRNILDRRLRDIGIGIAPGAPLAVRGHAATYTTDFGSP